MHLEDAAINHTQMGHVPKILVVDDESSVRMAMEMALANEGYELYFADDGQQGLKVFQQEAPELIFLDLKMPVMDGYGFLKAVQFKHDSPFTLVVMTGHGDDREIESCYKMGIDFFLKKPLNMVEICGLAKRCIELKRLEKERGRLLAELEESRNKLEQRVAERTVELSEMIATLEEQIKQNEILSEKLGMKTTALQESNIALKVLMKQREEVTKELEKNILFNINKLVKPSLEKLKKNTSDNNQKVYLEIIESNLNEIVSPFAPKLTDNLSKLTPAQVQIANLIQQGKTTKEIADLLSLSSTTIATHRQNIRKKLTLTNKKMNLRSILTTRHQ